MLTIEGARALNIADEIGSLQAGKQADLFVVDLDTPKFAPVNNVFAHVVNQTTPVDVETVIVDSTVVMQAGDVKTMDTQNVINRVENAMERFEDDTGWSFDIDGIETPSALSALRDTPKSGPMCMFARLLLQSTKDKLSG
jgi:formylmethanofuran dehydrogenase subunit A